MPNPVLTNAIDALASRRDLSEQQTAEVLAEIMHGRCYPFPGGIGDSFVAVSGDEHGTMIEVYPEDITLFPDRANPR